MIWAGKGFSFDLSRRVPVMGIINVTPDSFSDGGRYLEPEYAVTHGLRLVAEGADILDIGGESTRPGSDPVDVEHETERVLPVIESLVKQVKTPISIDTRKAEVAEAALAAGAVIVNDVTALSDPDMAAVVKKHDAGLVLMHMKGTPKTMQDKPHYDDLWGEILALLRRAEEQARAAGIERERIAVDPGIGFGKTLSHNLQIIRELSRLAELSYPILIGPSRKRFIGELTGRETSDRMPGTIAAITAAISAGARIVRVHDVAPSVQAVRVAEAIAGVRP